MSTQQNIRSPIEQHEQRGYWYWLGPLLMVMLATWYFIGRYQGYWAEIDSTAFTNMIRVFRSEGRLIPQGGEAYPHGFGYQAISTFVVSLTGIQVVTLQQVVYPLIVPLMVFPAWALYREFTDSPRGAAIATALLFTQPEFLFVVLRSSHEKFTRTFILLCLLLLTRSLHLRDNTRLFTLHVALFYICVFALIAGNVGIAFSFQIAIALALAGALIYKQVLWLREPVLRWLVVWLNVVLARLQPLPGRLRWPAGQRVARLLAWRVPAPGPGQPFDSHVIQRLAYVMLISIGMVYLFVNYIYPPARDSLGLVQQVVAPEEPEAEKTSKPSQQEEEPEDNSPHYEQHITFDWRHPALFVILGLGNWIILLAASLIWVWRGLRWFWSGWMEGSQAVGLLWFLYPAFAAQIVLSVVADSSGSPGGNALQRIFPSVSMFAVALVGGALANWRPRRLARVVHGAVVGGMFLIAMLSIFKATNEPLFRNKWTFYRPQEMTAMVWTDAHLRSRAQVWTEIEERLSVAFRTVRGISSNNDSPNFERFPSIYPPTDQMRDILVTDVTRMRSSRTGIPVPLPFDAFRVYDNGEAQLYHRRPRTPHQR